MSITLQHWGAVLMRINHGVRQVLTHLPIALQIQASLYSQLRHVRELGGDLYVSRRASRFEIAH